MFYKNEYGYTVRAVVMCICSVACEVIACHVLVYLLMYLNYRSFWLE